MGMTELGHGWGMSLWWLLILLVVVWGAWTCFRRRPPSE